MAFTTEQIRDYLMANPGMTDAQIAADMDRFGVTASQVSAATGVPVSDVMSRYEAATTTPAFPAGMFSTPGVVGAPAVAAPAPAPVTIADYEGKLYNPDTLRNLYSQIVPRVDLNQLYGGVYNTSGESVGFNYDVGSQVLAPILGDRAPTSTEQLVLDMARYLNNRGITDLSQLTPEMAGRFGETYTGGGGTAYNVNFTPEGVPVFGTSGFNTSDKDKIITALAVGAALFGIPGLTNGIFGSGAGAAGAEAASALGQGAWLGEGIASGIPAWDAAALAAGNTLAGVSPALLDAQFIAADAAQLAAQTGNNAAAIQQNLIAAGVDPIVAATAADAAALGLTGSELITTIAGAGQTGAGLFTGGSVADLALGGITTTTGAPAGSTVTGGGATTGGSGGTTTTTGGGTTTTVPGGLPPGVTTTLTNLLTNPNTLASLLGLFGGRALGGGVPTGPDSIPTQGIPVNTPEYFNTVQGFLNQYLPGQMPNQAQYLQSWYGSGGGMSPDTSVLQQVGFMPKTSVSSIPLRPTTPLPPPPPPPPATGVSLEDIRAYLGARPGLTDAEIAAAMDQYGVTAAQMSAATGVPFAEVLDRYQEATGRVAFPAGMFSTPGIVLSPSDYARPTDSGGGGGVSTQQIVDFLEANPGMSDAAIASAMDQYGVTASQMSAATGVPLAEVMERYEAATGRPAFPAGMFSL